MEIYKLGGTYFQLYSLAGIFLKCGTIFRILVFLFLSIYFTQSYVDVISKLIKNKDSLSNTENVNASIQAGTLRFNFLL